MWMHWLPNAVTVLIVGGIMFADLMEETITIWKAGLWLAIWIAVAAACLVSVRR